MRSSFKPQSLLEWIAFTFNLVPKPILHTNVNAHLSRSLLDAVALDVFECIGHSSLTLEELSEKTTLNKTALYNVMHVLTSADYFSYKNQKFSLTAVSKKWLLKDSEHSMYHGILLFRFLWSYFEHMPKYLQTGKGLDMHQMLTPEQWDIYQKAMFEFSRGGIKEMIKKTPVPKHPAAMLDIAGSHGLLSVELCKKHPGLESVIFELPLAIEKASLILKSYYSGNSVKFMAGDILKDDLGENKYDIINMANLAHFFSTEQNIMVAKKIARALKPGGIYILQDMVQPVLNNHDDLLMSIQNLFFGLIGSVGTYPLEEMRNWQEQAGLKHLKTNTFITIPYEAQVIGIKG